MKQFLALTISVLFLFPGALYPFDQVTIPAQLASVKESFRAPAEGNLPLIIQIQDAHCNYEAQKNLAGILEGLVKDYKLKLVLVEGGSGNVSLSFLRTYAAPKARSEIAEKYLRQGKISGEEYLDIVSDYELELYGIEDGDLYDEHVAVFEQIDAIKNESLNVLAKMEDAVVRLKPKLYSQQALDFESQKKSYEDKKLSLSEYSSYLQKTARDVMIDLGKYPQLERFVQTAQLEKSLDFRQAEEERNSFIKELAPMLGQDQVRQLIGASQDFKSGKTDTAAYYALLGSLAQDKISIADRYPQLYGYMEYIDTSKKIVAAELLKEISRIENEVLAALLATPPQKMLGSVDRDIAIVRGFINLALTPEDFAYFKAHQDEFAAAEWVRFISEQSASFQIPAEELDPAVIDDNLAVLVQFYTIGQEREHAFLKNIEKRLKDSDDQVVVLITGGFHTPGISSMLRDRGYSYVVVTPVITKKTDSSVYLSVLRQQNNPLEEASQEDQ